MPVIETANQSILQRLVNHSGLKKYFFNTSWMMVENIARLIAGFFIGVYVARYLGPEQFGVFSYSLAFVSLFSSVSKLGLDSIVVREIIKRPDEVDELMGTAFWLKVFAATFSIIFILLVLLLTSHDKQTGLYIFIIAAGLIFQTFDVVDFFFQAKVQAKYIAICKTLELLVLNSLRLYLIYVEAQLIWFVCLTLFSSFALGLFYVFAIYSKGSLIFLKKFNYSQAAAYLKDSWPLILSGMLTMIYLRSDQIMIKAMLGEKEVGLYSAAVRLSEVWYFVPTILAASLFPAIINSKKVDEDLYYSRLQNFFSLMVWLALGIALLGTLFGDWLVNILFGNQYVESSSVLKIHLWGGVLLFWESPVPGGI